MNQNLKNTIVDKFEHMTDETARQLLDYIEFLESRFNRSRRERSTLERLAENVEGTLRSSRLGEAAMKGTGDLIDAASSFARGVAAASQAMLDELQDAVADGRDRGSESDKPNDICKEDDSAKQSPEEPEAPETFEGNAREGKAGGEKTSA